MSSWCWFSAVMALWLRFLEVKIMDERREEGEVGGDTCPVGIGGFGIVVDGCAPFELG